jgi:serine/threonine protein kinase
VAAQIAAGLAAAHEHGLIHRDIKPDNIWMEAKTGRAKILDFGLARSIDGDGGLTTSGLVVGTPKYMSPEQAECKEVDSRCDLFSLGSLLYELVSGTAPFEGGNLTASLIAVAQAKCEPIDEVCPDVDADLASLIKRLLARDKESRPATAVAVLESLTAIGRKLKNQQRFTETAELSAVSAPAADVRPTTPRGLMLAGADWSQPQLL